MYYAKESGINASSINSAVKSCEAKDDPIGIGDNKHLNQNSGQGATFIICKQNTDTNEWEYVGVQNVFSGLGKRNFCNFFQLSSGGDMSLKKQNSACRHNPGSKFGYVVVRGVYKAKVVDGKNSISSDNILFVGLDNGSLVMHSLANDELSDIGRSYSDSAVRSLFVLPENDEVKNIYQLLVALRQGHNNGSHTGDIYASNVNDLDKSSSYPNKNNDIASLNSGIEQMVFLPEDQSVSDVQDDSKTMGTLYIMRRDDKIKVCDVVVSGSVTGQPITPLSCSTFVTTNHNATAIALSDDANDDADVTPRLYEGDDHGNVFSYDKNGNLLNTIVDGDGSKEVAGLAVSGTRLYITLIDRNEKKTYLRVCDDDSTPNCQSFGGGISGLATKGISVLKTPIQGYPYLSKSAFFAINDKNDSGDKIVNVYRAVCLAGTKCTSANLKYISSISGSTCDSSDSKPYVYGCGNTTIVSGNQNSDTPTREILVPVITNNNNYTIYDCKFGLIFNHCGMLTKNDKQEFFSGKILSLTSVNRINLAN